MIYNCAFVGRNKNKKLYICNCSVAYYFYTKYLPEKIYIYIYIAASYSQMSKRVLSLINVDYC